MYPSPEEVLAIIGDLDQSIRSIPFRAWDELMADERTALLLFTRTRSTYMFDVMARLARQEFASEDVIVEYQEHGTTLWIVREKLLLRFKKLNKRNRPMNIPTQRSLDLLLQPEEYRKIPLPFFPLPIEVLPRVVVGYVLNKLETQIEQILLVMTHGETNLWEHSFDIEAGGRLIDLPALGDAISGLPPSRPRWIDEENEEDDDEQDGSST